MQSKTVGFKRLWNQEKKAIPCLLLTNSLNSISHWIEWILLFVLTVNAAPPWSLSSNGAWERRATCKNSAGRRFPGGQGYDFFYHAARHLGRIAAFNWHSLRYPERECLEITVGCFLNHWPHKELDGLFRPIKAWMETTLGYKERCVVALKGLAMDGQWPVCKFRACCV